MYQSGEAYFLIFHKCGPVLYNNHPYFSSRFLHQPLGYKIDRNYVFSDYLIGPYLFGPNLGAGGPCAHTNVRPNKVRPFKVRPF